VASRHHVDSGVKKPAVSHTSAPPNTHKPTQDPTSNSPIHWIATTTPGAGKTSPEHTMRYLELKIGKDTIQKNSKPQKDRPTVNHPKTPKERSQNRNPENRKTQPKTKKKNSTNISVWATLRDGGAAHAQSSRAKVPLEKAASQPC